MKLIRELRDEIRRLKSIITTAKLGDPELLLGSESVLEENIHKKEEMVSTGGWVYLRGVSVDGVGMCDAQ